MAAARQDLDPRIAQPLADLAHRLRRCDHILVTRHHQGGTGDGSRVGRLGAGQRLARPGIAVGRLAHHRFAYHRHGRRLACTRVGRGRGLDDRVGNRLQAGIALAARLLGARPDARPGGIGRGEQRPEQRQAAHQLRRRRGEMKGHDGAHGMADHVRPLDIEAGAEALHRLHKALDGERSVDARGPSRARQVGPHSAVAHQGRHQRHPHIGGAAQPVNQQYVVARSVGLHRDPIDVLGGHLSPPTPRRDAGRRSPPEPAPWRSGHPS